MKKLMISLVAIMTMMILSSCGSDTTAADSGDTYNVSVDNVGDGDIVVNTGSGTVIIGANDSCIVVLDNNITRPCTSAEFDDAYATSSTI